MTRSEIEALLARHRASFHRLDAAALAADHLADGTFESPAHGLVRGRQAIEEVYRYWFTAYPDMRFDWTDAIIDGSRAAFFWTFEGTLRGPFFGVLNPGAHIAMEGAAEYGFARGGIESARHIFDFSGVLMKAGILKARPA
jgi:predicted ester cyclase